MPRAVTLVLALAAAVACLALAADAASIVHKRLKRAHAHAHRHTHLHHRHEHVQRRTAAAADAGADSDADADADADATVGSDYDVPMDANGRFDYFYPGRRPVSTGDWSPAPLTKHDGIEVWNNRFLVYSMQSCVGKKVPDARGRMLGLAQLERVWKLGSTPVTCLMAVSGKLIDHGGRPAERSARRHELETCAKEHGCVYVAWDANKPVALSPGQRDLDNAAWPARAAPANVRCEWADRADEGKEDDDDGGGDAGHHTSVRCTPTGGRAVWGNRYGVCAAAKLFRGAEDLGHPVFRRFVEVKVPLAGLAYENLARAALDRVAERTHELIVSRVKKAKKLLGVAQLAPAVHDHLVWLVERDGGAYAEVARDPAYANVTAFVPQSSCNTCQAVFTEPVATMVGARNAARVYEAAEHAALDRQLKSGAAAAAASAAAESKEDDDGRPPTNAELCRKACFAQPMPPADAAQCGDGGPPKDAAGKAAAGKAAAGKAAAGKAAAGEAAAGEAAAGKAAVGKAAAGKAAAGEAAAGEAAAGKAPAGAAAAAADAAPDAPSCSVPERAAWRKGCAQLCSVATSKGTKLAVALAAVGVAGAVAQRYELIGAAVKLYSAANGMPN